MKEELELLAEVNNYRQIVKKNKDKLKELIENMSFQKEDYFINPKFLVYKVLLEIIF